LSKTEKPNTLITKTKTLRCSCASLMQDKEHGAGNRLHNLSVKDGKPKGWRCTVCLGMKGL
jgi:hypothetical protein